MRKGVVVHYDEIATKGKNRKFFEKKLVDLINCAFKKEGIKSKAKLSWGRIYIENIDEGQEKIIEDILKKLPGVANFGLFRRFETYEDLLNYAKEAVELVKNKSFRVSAKRTDKSFHKKSFEVEKEFSALMFKENPNLKVNLKNFEEEIKVEIINKNKILLYLKKQGIAGLPVNSSGKAVVLMSAGFDSPVAGFLMQKRGIEIFPLHFHSAEKTGEEPLQAVKDLSYILSKNQCKLTLALVNVLPAQKYIALNAPEKLRIILLRRLFMRVAEKYAQKIGALSLVTGESIGQVASQTLENILAIDNASTLPVLRPLSGLNKNEIINIARKIKTDEISARPCEDTCALFVPENPETKSKLPELLKEEEKLVDLSKYENEMLEELEIIRF